MCIADLIDMWSNITLLNADNESISLELNNPNTEDEIVRWEERFELAIPDQLRRLLLTSNGLTLFDVHIMSLQELLVNPHLPMIAFHNWGNGDFDYVVCTPQSRFPENAVVFGSQNSERWVKVCQDIESWLIGVVDEIREHGALAHPDDFLRIVQDQDESRLYAAASQEWLKRQPGAQPG